MHCCCRWVKVKQIFLARKASIFSALSRNAKRRSLRRKAATNAYSPSIMAKISLYCGFGFVKASLCYPRHTRFRVSIHGICFYAIHLNGCHKNVCVCAYVVVWRAATIRQREIFDLVVTVVSYISKVECSVARNRNINKYPILGIHI